MSEKPAVIKTDTGLAGAQTSRAMIELRNLIAGGTFAADERLTETQLSDILGMSRTPIRAAVQHLRDEGLLEPRPGGGYVVRAFSPREIGEAVELRGMIEGLAARIVAERGIAPAALARLEDITARIDGELANPLFDADRVVSYVRLNAEFHEALAEATESTLIVHEARRANARPFAGANALVRATENSDAIHRHLIIAQDQHKAVIEAIQAREGARAEAIMREHARLSRRNLSRALSERGSLAAIPGASLIRRAR